MFDIPNIYYFTYYPMTNDVILTSGIEQPTTIEKVQATGWLDYFIWFFVAIVIAIFLLKAMFSSKKDWGETEGEYLRRISQANKRNQELAENEDLIMTKQFPNWIKKSEYYEKKRKGEIK